MFQRKRLTLGSIALCVALVPASAHAHNPFEFQTPVTPVAHETLYVHDLFLTIIVCLFMFGFGFLLYSVIRFRRSRGHAPATFTEDLLARGKQNYATYCALCHQPTGLGMPGAIPPIAGGGRLSPRRK
jgi:hypothetical protein